MALSLDQWKEYSRWVKEEAHREGFFHCGISRAERLEEEAPRLERWLEQGKQGKMHWMERNFEKRLDPRLLVDGAKSVISVIYNYYPNEERRAPDAPKISKYAYGEDYHFVLKDRLRALVSRMEKSFGEFNHRVFVDSAPVMDKAWAAKSGLGWRGKNSMLLTRQQGSFFFIGEIICDLELEPDGPVKDYCGTCTRCIDACPTGAIDHYEVDGTKCISYLTIELKDDQLPPEMKGKMKDWAFGCDICQDVCPWNKFSLPHQEPRFEPHPDLLGMTRNDWKDLEEDSFRELFKRSAVKRAKFKGLKRNLRFIMETDEPQEG
ncbi:MAG: tRNA epoxyqueuosine(34) reductase QueG [Flavobacteriales bacterium]